MRARKRWLAFTAIGAVVAVLITAGTAAGEPTPSPEVGQRTAAYSTEEAFFIEQSQRLRPKLGLRSDIEYLESIVVDGVDPVGGEAVVTAAETGWWIPMTRSETNFTNNTLKLADDWIPEVERILANDPEAGYAGAYANHARGVVTVRAVNIEYAKARLLTVNGASESLEFVPAKNSLSELSAARERVKALMDEGLKAGNPTIMSTGTDVVNNTLEVGLKDTSTFRDASLAVAVGNVTVVYRQDGFIQTNGTNAMVSPPLRGGSIIVRAISGVCTTGYIGIRDGQRWVITAGHCGDGVWRQGPSYSSGYEIGNSGPADSCNSAGCPRDVRRIGPVGSKPVSRQIWESPSGVRSITTWQGQNQDNIYDRICMSGAVTLYPTCDQVYRKDYSKTYSGGFKVDWLRMTQYLRAGGDSGGPVYDQNTNRAAGMHIGQDDDAIFAVYMHIYDVLSWSGMNGGLYVS